MFLIVVMLLTLSGCSSRQTGLADYIKHPPVRAFYATDRNYTGPADETGLYGDKRDSVSYGTVIVTVPQRHSIGKIENHEDARDSSRCFFVLDLSRLEKRAFFSSLADATNKARKQDILLYVHGYNTSFKEAAQAMAQISNDIDFMGCPVLYSWPSKSKISSYVADESTVEWSQKNLKYFLKDLAMYSKADRIYLLAHSIGNRELTSAFVELTRENPELKGRFKALVLAAADIDSAIFIRDIAPFIKESGTMTTLYVSRKDKALGFSNRLHEYSRAGESEYRPIIMPGIETIDTTDVDDSYMGHGYFSSCRSVLSDIYYIINYNLKADSRFSLQSVDTKEGRFWKFNK
jgi:esterase/lipase superfamily enzyme